jgi:hypothetical protein
MTRPWKANMHIHRRRAQDSVLIDLSKQLAPQQMFK